MGAAEDEAEFAALSAKVAAKTASATDQERWREIRARLVARPVSAPPGGQVRGHLRAAKKVRVVYAPVSELLVSFTDDLGGGGLRFTSPRHFDPGAELVVRLEPAGAGDPNPIVALGRVAWSRREGGHFVIGVELAQVRSEDRERIDALAHTLTPLKPQGG